MANEVRRTGDLRVKLAPDMLARLEAMATAYGMPGATFAAFAIADFINRQDNNQKLTRMAVLDMARNFGIDEKQLENLERLATAMGPGVAKVLSQVNLPLDHEGPEGQQ